MSDYNPDNENFDPDDPDADAPPDDPNSPKNLRQAAKDGRKAREEADAANTRADNLAKELAFTKAGVNTDTPVGVMFAQTYTGDLTAEAVKEAWAAIESTLASPNGDGKEGDDAPANPELQPGEADAGALSQQLAQGTAPDAPSEPDPYEVAAGIADQARKDGATEIDAMAYAFNSVVGAAQKGDQRAIIPNPAGVPER